MLHVTSGDVAVGAIAATGTPGEIVPWRDVLHEGPVPAGLSQSELREVRARFIAAQGWGSYMQVLDDLTRRDKAVARASDHDEVVLWFEDDLYDQLQLAQVVDSFARLPLGALRLTLVSFVGGVGEQDSGALVQAFAAREPLTAAHLALATRTWEAFRSPDPGAVEDVIAEGPSPLFPFLHDALARLLEEFPSSRNGLSRTETQALDTLAGGVATLREAYVAAHHRREERVFLGDVVFALVVARLGRGVHPLLEAADGARITLPGDPDETARFWNRPVALTATGRLVLEGRVDAARINGINRWVGGVHLHGHEPAWRWDSAARRLRAATV